MSTLTLTHHISKFIGAYWYTLEGTVFDSEGNTVDIYEGTGKLSTINKSIKFYKTNGFSWFCVNHVVNAELDSAEFKKRHGLTGEAEA